MSPWGQLRFLILLSGPNNFRLQRLMTEYFTPAVLNDSHRIHDTIPNPHSFTGTGVPRASRSKDTTRCLLTSLLLGNLAPLLTPSTTPSCSHPHSTVEPNWSTSQFTRLGSHGSHRRGLVDGPPDVRSRIALPTLVEIRGYWTPYDSRCLTEGVPEDFPCRIGSCGTPTPVRPRTPPRVRTPETGWTRLEQ